MLYKVVFLTIITGWFSTGLLAQIVPEADSLTRPAAPIFVQTSLLVSPQSLGARIGIGQVLSETEIHIFKKSGRQKVIFKDRILSINPGFYYQKYLHTNLFLTVDYAFVRRHRRGFYRTFAPLVGVSRTFLTATTYTVDDTGVVGQDKTAGDWRVMAGFTWGIGKRFNTVKPGVLRDIHLAVNVPFFYPNFRSVALKPSLQIGAAFNLSRLRRSVLKNTKTIRR